MKIKHLSSWEEFETEYQELLTFIEAMRQRAISSVSNPLFRGQNETIWPLCSTLDRIKPNCSLREYHNLLQRIAKIVGNCTDKDWHVPEYKNPKQAFWFVPQAYEFMAYLRHHGFPSPLLDWSRSPYIAAFFAFNSPLSESDVAIFSFIETIGYGKGGLEDGPFITSLGPSIRSHKRHYLQQSEYTICTKVDDDNFLYAQYEEAIVQVMPEQDLFVKYILPISQKAKVLAKLDLMNINAYSLFGSEEALMDTLRNREFQV